MGFRLKKHIPTANARKVNDNSAFSSLQHGDSTMYWAARQGHTDAIQYLWEQKAKVNTHNKVSLCLCCSIKYGNTSDSDQIQLSRGCY